MNVETMIKVFFGMILGVILHASVSEKEVVVEAEICDSMEESRLRMAMKECDEAVMYHVWGEEYETTAHEEEE